MNKNSIRRISIIGIILLVLLIIILPKLLSRKNVSDRRDLSGERNPILKVSAMIVKASQFENKFSTNGSILANEEVELRSEISGKVVSINFREGSKVKRGELLVKINDAELQANLLKTELKKKLAEEKEFRQRALLEKQAVSQESYDAILNELNTLKADIDNIRAQIDKTEIRAPFDGTIGLRYISIGSYITPSTKIATLQNNNPIKIEFAIPQKYYSYLSQNKEVQILVPNSSKRYT
ncbi:MAG: efflux RND transporter periplasmic adaptor subunit, partial [Ignavibacteria bacterium]|nr:efflux RND transporter periplasmic adaptor subunit [Ignavibacteria bacterium]